MFGSFIFLNTNVFAFLYRSVCADPLASTEYATVCLQSFMSLSLSSTSVICFRMVEEIQNMTESPPSPAPEPVSPVPGLGAAESVLQWHFLQLDVDGDGALSEREARPLRQYLRRTLKPRRCAKKFTQYCDQDQDAALSLLELNRCLGL